MKTFLSAEFAHGGQIKHGKLVRDLDRVRSMLSPGFAAYPELYVVVGGVVPGWG